MGLGVFLVATPYPIAVLKKKIFTKDKGIRKNNYQSRVFLDDEMRIHKRKTECESRWNRKMGDLDRVLLDGVKVKENSLKPLQIDNFMRDKH